MNSVLYCLDTNILIDLIRKKKEVEKYFFTDLIVYVPAVVVGELWQGARDKKELRLLKHMVQHLEVMHDSGAVTQRALELLERYMFKQGVSYFDCLVAASALENGAILVTKNKKHFASIEGLQIEVPEA